MTDKKRIPLLNVWQTEDGLEIKMVKSILNKYVILGILEDIKFNVLSDMVDEPTMEERKSDEIDEDELPEDFRNMSFGKFDA